jgi:mannonate dehydratase
MKITFRWYGEEDPVPLQYIRQVPAVKGIVSALYDIPSGELWPLEKLQALKSTVEKQGLELLVIESIPVHEDIKLGKASRDRYIDTYRESVRNMGRAGIPFLCYNFMPVFDWTRTTLDRRLEDGSTALGYDHEELVGFDLKKDSLDLPGWGTKYSSAELSGLLDEYSEISEEKLWENLAYFLQAVVPAAEEAGVRMAIHPDDPPWPIFGLPRIITDESALLRLTSIVDSPSNGLTFCTGSLGPNRQMDLVRALKRFAEKGRVHFVHARNIRREGELSFHETEHLSGSGDVDMFRVMEVLVDTGFQGVLRPDHGRMIWGETGRPGYGLYDRALGAMYLEGLREAIEKTRG